MLAHFTMEIEGQRPLLMHNDKLLVDPLHPLNKAKAVLASKVASKRTEEEEIELRRLEWLMSLYHDDRGPHIPSVNVAACLIQAGKATKHGQAVKRSVIVFDDLVLDYPGPRDTENLWDKGYLDTRPVNVGTGGQAKRIIRCRPCFNTWRGEVHVSVDTTLLDIADFKAIVERAGMAGLGDFRPHFGRFESKLTRAKKA
jgi:hypothetical protein